MDPRTWLAGWRKNDLFVPAFMRGFLYTVLMGSAIVSVPFIGTYGPAPITAFLDAWVIAFILVCLSRGKVQTKLILVALAAYLLASVIPVLANWGPFEEFLRAYRWVFYLVAFAFAMGRKWGPVEPLIKVTWGLLGLATLKGLLTLVILGPGQRPGLLVESNFELALFSGLLLIVYRHMARSGPWALGLLGLLSILAGSRSGAVAFAIVAIYAIILARPVHRLTRYLRVLAIPVLLGVPIAIFTMRALATSLPIDRLRFLTVFIDETRGWTWVTWLIGTPPLTPLSSEGCEQLSFYQSLFSFAGDGACYSVIFHAFFLRVIFDAGVIGLLISLLVPWYLMRRARVQFMLAGALMLVAISNGLSVSGFNSPFVTMPILLAMLLAADNQRPNSAERADQRTDGASAEGLTATLPRERARWPN